MKPEDLPPLHTGDIDDATLGALLDDLEACTELFGVRVKGGPTSRTEPGKVELRDAADRLRRGEVRAIQIQYRYQGSEWLDTVMTGPAGYRVVRFNVP